MRIYLAGPMTGIPQYNYPAFLAAEEDLKALNLGLKVENPTQTFFGRTDLPYTTYMHAGFVQVLRSDAILVLDGWQASKGARREIAIMQWLERPVWELKNFLRLPHAHINAWKADDWQNNGPRITVKTAIAPGEANFFHAGHIV